MKCYKCGYDLEERKVCPNCGADNTIYRSILYNSARCYNEGLSLARVRNLTGAAAKLTAALRFNKYNTDARNLLGLVYFETGETVLAIREWVISKNLQPSDNDVDRYLNEIEYGPGMLQKLDETNRKYNQALEYCREGSRDLTRIQLKRVLKNQPKMVKARLLLALIYMQDNEYENARKELHYAQRIDGGNPLTLSYLSEVRNVLREKNGKKKGKKETAKAMSFQDGNDTVVMPRPSFIEALDASKGGILNILIGALIGLLVCIFLIVPEVRQRENTATSNALVSANENAANSRTDVDSLTQQVTDLQTKLDQYEGKADVKTSYESLLSAVNAAAAGDMDTARTALSGVTRDILDANGQSSYDTLTGQLNAASLKSSFDSAEQLKKEGKYDDAIVQYSSVVSLEEGYSDGAALYGLAECYEKKEDYANAAAKYSRAAELFPDSSLGRRAKKKAANMTKKAEEAGQTAADGNGTAEGNGTADGNQ